MSVKVAVKIPSLAGMATQFTQRLQRAQEGGLTDADGELKLELRAAMAAAGLPTKLGFTWRDKMYANREIPLSSRGHVYSKAPHIAKFFSEDAVVVPLNGKRYLAIPTASVPKGQKGKPLPPREVELRFSQKLLVLRSKDHPTHRLAFIIDGIGRNKRKVLMFTFVPNIHGRKRYDIVSYANKVGATIPEKIAAHLESGQ